MSGKKSHIEESPAPDLTIGVSSWIASGLFILLSAGLIPYVGIQEDEALFTNTLYLPTSREFVLRIFHHDVPLMLMSYFGTLKALIYWPLLAWFGPGIWTVRLPVTLIGAATVFIFYRLVRLSGGRWAAGAAALGAFVLATDPAFILTNTFDWGPVAIEHILLVAACFALARFAIDPARQWLLGIGFFLLGLALWNKAIFLWALTGAAAGTLLVFWPQVKKCASRRNFAIAGAGFLLGASPFVLYNLRHPGATLGENAHWDASRLPAKWIQVENAFNGSSLFGYIAEQEWNGPAKKEVSTLGHVVSGIRQAIGPHQKSGFLYAFGVLLIAGAPLWWRSRAARFSLVFLCVTWAMMALTKDAGAAAHHVVLLWPFPVLFAAVTIAAIPWRWVAACAGTVLVIMNLLVVNQYFYQFQHYGGAGNFTDALLVLPSALPSEPGTPIFVMDWGIYSGLELAYQGRAPVYSALDIFDASPLTPAGERRIRAMLASPGGVYVTHVPERESLPGIAEHLDQLALTWGYRREPIRTVQDSNGRPVFQIYRYVKP